MNKDYVVNNLKAINNIHAIANDYGYKVIYTFLILNAKTVTLDFTTLDIEKFITEYPNLQVRGSNGNIPMNTLEYVTRYMNEGVNKFWFSSIKLDGKLSYNYNYYLIKLNKE